MRWIKASERLPERDGCYSAKYLHMGAGLDITNGQIRHLSLPHKMVEDINIEYLEWLDESDPAPGWATAGVILFKYGHDKYNVTRLEAQQAMHEFASLKLAQKEAAVRELVDGLKQFLKVINRTPTALEYYGDAIKISEALVDKYGS